MSKTWDIKKLHDKIEQLSFKTEDIKKKESLLFDLELLRDTIDSEKYENTKILSLQDNFEFAGERILTHFYTWSALNKFEQISQFNGGIDWNFSFLDMKDEEILCLTHDFYKEAIGGFFYQEFLKQFKFRNDHINFLPSREDLEGETSFIKSFNEAFIEIYLQKNIIDIPITIHEYAHAIHYQLNYNQECYVKYQPFHELLANFMQLLAYDYFIGNSEFQKEAIKAKDFTWYDTVLEVIDLNNLYRIFQIKGYKNLSQLKRKAKKELNIDNDEFKDLLSPSNITYLPYAYGMIVAIELLHIYYNDREKALYLLKKIITSSARDGYELQKEMLKLGIRPCEHIENYENQLKRELTLLP